MHAELVEAFRSIFQRPANAVSRIPMDEEMCEQPIRCLTFSAGQTTQRDRQAIDHADFALVRENLDVSTVKERL